MPEILVKKTRAEPGEASLEVSIPPENVRAAEDRATKFYQARARLPGFRQGKAPAAVVKKKFADDIRQETLRELVQESWRVAQKQEELKPIADPHIHNLKWEAGAPVTFEFHVELKPELKLERLGNFRLTRTVKAVTAAQVDSQINALREQRAPWTPVAGEKPKPKDLVDVIIATRENGAEKDPQPYQFVLGEGRAIPEVEERIMSLLPGESVEATVRFPDDFAEEAKRGQTRDVKITLREVKRQELPPLDDAFARETGDFESVDALRAAVTTDLTREAEREADAKVRGELVQQIVDANNVAAPRPLVERVLGAYAQ
ncbi:MAG TPA: trigger factor, partial [Gemmatimonadales bacterium]|nr:trigger factor [Gemmatimonadales bacterium]